LDDALNLARSGKLSYDIALGVTVYLAKETEYVPWTAALDGLRYISKMLMRTSAYGEFRDYSRRLITPLLERVGFQEKPNDQPLDVQVFKHQQKLWSFLNLPLFP
jgi:aminopeptidase N